MKYIHVALPKNRMETGGLVMYGDGIRTPFPCPVRGKADNNEAKKYGNKHRDVVLPYGDTPAGLCEPAEWVFIPPRSRQFKSFGEAFLPLQGVSGAFKEAMDRGRTGMGLHGGAGECLELPGMLYLKATYGCLRVRDSDLARIIGLSVSGQDLEGAPIYDQIEVKISDI